MPRTTAVTVQRQQMPMFQCYSVNHYDSGCNNIFPADQIVAKTKHRMQRDGYDAVTINAVPNLTEHTPKAIKVVCPHCGGWRSLTNNNMRFVGYGEVEVVGS